MYGDEIKTFTPDKNPAYKFSEVGLWLAYNESGQIVGRVAAIINKLANEKWNHKEVRYGWLEFVDNQEVSQALIDKVIEFGKKRGMDRIVGPLGFTDFDAEGMVVEGFDQMASFMLAYNYPYYPKHFEAMGFKKEIDWLEYKIYIPDEVPERIVRISNLIQQKYGYHYKTVTKKMVTKEGYGQKIFDLVNECYGTLYNFTILPQDVIDSYIDSYLGVLDMKYVSLVEDENDNLVAFGVAMPSLARAMQKCGGHLFPFGWIHAAKTLYFKHDEILELMLIGVKPEHRNKGLLAMIFNDMIPTLIKEGFEYAESNAELENNMRIQNPWEMFKYEQKKRRRIYGKDI